MARSPAERSVGIFERFDKGNWYKLILKLSALGKTCQKMRKNAAAVKQEWQNWLIWSAKDWLLLVGPFFFVQLSKSIKEYKPSYSWQSNGSGMVVCSGESTHVWHRLTGFCCHHRIIWDLGIWHLAARFPRCIGTFYWAPPNPSQQMGMDQYLLIPFLVGWISSNPSYFDVNYRGTGFWPIPKMSLSEIGNIMGVFFEKGSLGCESLIVRQTQSFTQSSL